MFSAKKSLETAVILVKFNGNLYLQRKRKRIYSKRFQKDTMDPVFLMHLILSLFMQYFQTYERFCSAKYCFYTVSVLSERFNALISNMTSEIEYIYLPK